jgi:hypothetical protein
LLPFLACNPNPSNYREQMTVYTTLDPGSSHQTVVVDRTYRVDQPTEDTSGVSGAVVRLWREGSEDTVLLPESSRQGFYNDTLPYPIILPCSTYRLDVVWQSFHGSALVTVPDTFNFTNPLRGDTLHLLGLPVFTWTPSRYSYAYLVIADNVGDSAYRFPLITRDTWITPYPAIFDTIGSHRLRIYALDANRYRYQTGSEMDTIGEDVLADIGAQTLDSTRVVVLP